MTQMEQNELKDRLELIEQMMAQGRRSTESWGWSFVLWGVAYYIAIAWSTWGFGGPIWGSHVLAWPVTMVSASILTVLLASRMNRNEKPPSTTIGRAITSIWIAMGISMFVLLLPMGLSGRGDQQVYIAVVAAMLATANAASSMILKWKAQFVCAMVWWAAAACSCFGSQLQSEIAFLVAIFLCQIAFGIYGMICEARERKQGGAVHA